MSKAKRNPEEEKALLLDDETEVEVCHRDSRPPYDTAIARGVVNHVAKWPSHVLAAFLAGSLVFVTFLMFVIVAALFCAPTTTHTCRRLKNVELTELPNVYFVKHANRTWSTRELCNVESTVRKNSEIKVVTQLLVAYHSVIDTSNKVYLINLLVKSRDDNTSIATNAERIEITYDREIIEMLWRKLKNLTKSVINSSEEMTMEENARRMLAEHYNNVRNLDVTVEDFFKGSMLSTICQKLDVETLEIAAKAYALWNHPGVALDPHDYRYLQRLRSYLCTHDCDTSLEAAINPQGSVQASGVPCQAFVGCLIHQIAVQKSSENRKIIEKCQQSFCRRLHECPGLNILNGETRSNDETTFCPTIFPSEIQTTSQKLFTHK